MLLTMRRLFGILMALVAGGYWYARFVELDISGLKLPEQIEAPIFWMGYAAVFVWCMMPQLIRTPGAQQVNLLPNAPMPFANQMMTNSDPFQMNGSWFVQWDGYLWKWNPELSTWELEQPPQI
jgi:hypothetical protein|tara:strand:+ start:219 stop:587 length:369 start_codon:yes stop_codon:yes gene_type:complete